MEQTTKTVSAMPRLLYADVLRSSATLMVIALHCSALYFYLAGIRYAWHFANIINSFMRPAVPLFLMLSGALLLSPHREETPLQFLKKHFFKIVPSLFVWSVFYYALNKVMSHSPASLTDFLGAFAGGGIYYHLPFLYYLLGLYLAYPLLRSFFRGSGRKEVVYFIGIWLLTIVLTNLSGYFQWGISGNLLIFYSFIGYPVIGQVMNSFESNSRRYGIAALIFLVASLATAVLTWYQRRSGGYAEFFYEYLSINVVIASLSLFYLFRFANWEKWLSGLIKKILSFISFYSFDVFLVHPFVLLVVKNYLLPAKLTANSFLGIPCLFITVSLLSLVLAYLIALAKKGFRRLLSSVAKFKQPVSFI